MALLDKLEEIFEADRTARRAEAALIKAKRAEVEILLAAETAKAKRIRNADEAGARLRRLADLCAQIPGTKTTETLLEILNSDHPDARLEAAEALVDRGCENFREFSAVIRRMLERVKSGPALLELPWVIGEIGSDDAALLIKPFIKNKDLEVVGSAVEALIAMGSPAAAEILGPLKDDRRLITIEDEETGDEVTLTIGELIRSAEMHGNCCCSDE